MQPTMLPKLTETTQTISFTEIDEDQQMTADVYATDVVVTTSAGSHSHGSSRVKLKNLVDYNWEPKLYPGQLLAVHLSGKYLAYCIKGKVPQNPGSVSGMVRVVYNGDTGTDRRALIKGMKGEVQDIAFAHIENEVILACIDEQGNFYVHQIELVDTALRCTLIAEVREDTGIAAAVGLQRVVWCPYVPDDDDTSDDDVARLLLTIHSNIARLWKMNAVALCLSGAGCAGSASALVSARSAGTWASEHAAPIADAALSPDGTAFATASRDGYIKFFQVFSEGEDPPRCLHQWQPHGGRPLSGIAFLDNRRSRSTEAQFWKFAVTGAENNTIIKIWACKSWSCLQTITFTPSPTSEPNTFGLKAMVDASATYLLMSDFRARSLYVLNMARDTDDTMAYCKSVSEYLLPYPVLSFCIIDAEEESSPEAVCTSPYLETQGPPAARLRVYIVQPKGLQEGEILHTPTDATEATQFPDISQLSVEAKSPQAVLGTPSGILQQQSRQLQSLLLRTQAQPGAIIVAEPPHQPLNLMTPDAFSSPGKREEEDPPLAATPEVAPLLGPDNKLTSGGSSPSREVQQIMNSQNPYPGDQMEEEESSQTLVADEEQETPSVVQNGTEPIYPTNDIYVSPEKPQNKITQNDTAWPQISIAQINEANQRKASSDKSSSQSLSNSLNVSAVERPGSEEPRQPGLSPADKSRLEALESKLDKLCSLVLQQSRDLRAMRAEMAAPRESIDEALHAHAQRTQQLVESALQDGWERIARVGETASARAAQAAGVGAARALEPLATALQHELAAKLTATDHLLRDNIDKLANSKTIMERLSSSIAKSLSDMVRESFRGALVDSVLPLMEKAHQQIFRQINHCFQQGTKEYVDLPSIVKSLSDMVRESFRGALVDSVLPLMEKAHQQIFRQINYCFQQGTKEFAANTEAAARAAAERGGAAATAALTAALQRHAEALQASVPPSQAIAHTVQEVAHSVLEKELVWWREQARLAAVQMSRAHSPATPSLSHASAVDRQMQVAQIQSLMSGGDMNGAFQLALSASDLSLVVSACKAAEPQAVFGPPCKLKQHVLLSLVQQLAADMARDTHLKHRYLEEAVMNLDKTNPVTREHLPVVIRELQKQIVAFLNASPGHALTRQFKMLLMAADSLVKSTV